MTLDLETSGILTGSNKAYLQDVYKTYLQNPSGVSADWRAFFSSLGDDIEVFLKEESLEAELDSSLFAKRNTPNSLINNALKTVQPDDVQKSVAALMMIHAYRARGHTKAKLDPLNLKECKSALELDPAYFGFSEKDMDQEIYIGGALGLESASLGKIVDILNETYCGAYAVEFIHSNDPEQKLWVQKNIEGYVARKVLSREERLTVLDHLIEAETFENFINTKHAGAKKFGLDGVDAFIPALKEAIKVSAENGVEDVVMGMAHRGRLNVLCNVMGKPLENLFAEFLGTVQHKSTNTSGDVKYHLGFSSKAVFGQQQVSLSLNSNPSHLEAVNPVVLGKTRAKQDLKQDEARKKSMALLVHGDAAFIGQGVVAECFNFSGLPGYQTGGTLHMVINNQIGFTTSAKFSYSSFHCTDLGKIIQAPIFHVNGDDVDSVVFMARLAAQFRAKFNKDVILDIVGYRRFGHNEGDDPTFTQPKMYQKIKEHASILSTYVNQLKKDHVLTEAEYQNKISRRFQELQQAYDKAKRGYTVEADWLQGYWQEFSSAEKNEKGTGVSKRILKKILRKLIQIPQDFTPHSKLSRLLAIKKKMIETEEGIDWGTAESLAFGTLLVEGASVRLSGQDCVRGTFSHRHAAWIDQKTENWYVPLAHLEEKQGRFEVLNSPLSEFSILGFEYGYSSTDPRSLVLWEAQFGDFANGAQVIFDQFISSSEVKWMRLSGLVVLLPHGYEGQGPEHSSARLERYLQMCAEDNMSVANCTTPANYFHILRRQLKRTYRKPLILMTPKSLLRHKRAASSIKEFDEGTVFKPVINDALCPNPQKVTRIIFCTGKVYYDLLEMREEEKLFQCALLRLEELYPFPETEIINILKSYPKSVQIIWCQEEPENMGSWHYIDRRLEHALTLAKMKNNRPTYVGRPASAATATGFLKQHQHEQEQLLAQALKV
jgi:2-oxoglutarate dehydrogenase E1 component